MRYGLALIAATTIAASLWSSPSLAGLVGAALSLLMLAIAAEDWRRFRVPDWLSAGAIALRGFDLLLSSRLRLDALDSAARGVTMFLAFFGFRALYELLRHREGLGFGDVKLAGVAGVWVAWRLLPFVVEAAALSGLALALAQSRRGGAFLRRDMRLPFAVGFAPAIWLGWWLERIGF